jgi:Xaa-Pro aminopeptidase
MVFKPGAYMAGASLREAPHLAKALYLAQSHPYMRYTPLTAETYIQHRKKLAATLPGGALCILHSNDIMPTNGDGTMGFRQNSDLLYLCGIDQEESVLVLFPECVNPAHREVLFLRETSEEIAIWEGEKLSKEKATALSGIRTVYWLSQYETILKALMAECSVVMLNSNEHLRRHNDVQTRQERLNQALREAYPLHTYQRIAPALHRLRSVKSREEIARMQHACNLTQAGFKRALSFIKPGVMEYEIEAEFLHEFVRQGSRGFAYTPIIASGYNACVLHYIDNNKPCADGDLLLMDVGAEYANYASDMTRTVPVNGRFTPRQRDVYMAVLRVMRAAMDLLKPGVMLQDYHKKVGELMEQELLGLELLTKADITAQKPEAPAYKKYFMHGTSHFLGLDVHDVGLWHEPIQPGMVFTVEPGIYIREERMGIRLENNILITETGYVDLMAHIPIEPDEIESLMGAAVTA